MSIHKFSDELREGYLKGERNKLLRNLLDSIEAAHKEDRELCDMGVSQEILGIIELFVQYVIEKGRVTPKKDTLRGIMDSEEDYRNRRPHEEEAKKLMEWRKILSVLRKYELVGMNLHLIQLSGGQIELVFGRLVIDKMNYISI